MSRGVRNSPVVMLVWIGCEIIPIASHCNFSMQGRSDFNKKCSVEIKYFECSVHNYFAYLLILAFNVQDVTMRNTNKQRGAQQSIGNVGLDWTWLGR